MQARLAVLALILVVPYAVQAQDTRPTPSISAQAKPKKHPGEIEIALSRIATRDVSEAVPVKTTGGVKYVMVLKKVKYTISENRTLVVDGVTIKATKKDGTPVGPNELARLLEANGKVLIFPNGGVDPVQVKAAAEGTVMIAGDVPGVFGVPTQNSGVRDSLRNGMRWVWDGAHRVLRPWDMRSKAPAAVISY